MKVNQFAFFVSIFILLSACATTKNPTNVTSVVPLTPDTSDPTLPITLIPIIDSDVAVIVREKPEEIEIEPLHERGSVESISRKMEGHPRTLYWGGKNTYSFYVGGILSAEYKPGEGLRIQEVKGDDSGVVCQFGETEADIQQNSACSQLMLTLDAELDD